VGAETRGRENAQGRAPRRATAGRRRSLRRGTHCDLLGVLALARARVITQFEVVAHRRRERGLNVLELAHPLVIRLAPRGAVALNLRLAHAPVLDQRGDALVGVLLSLLDLRAERLDRRRERVDLLVWHVDRAQHAAAELARSDRRRVRHGARRMRAKRARVCHGARGLEFDGCCRVVAKHHAAQANVLARVVAVRPARASVALRLRRRLVALISAAHDGATATARSARSLGCT
jgi:hypothetical protein